MKRLLLILVVSVLLLILNVAPVNAYDEPQEDFPPIYFPFEDFTVSTMEFDLEPYVVDDDVSDIIADWAILSKPEGSTVLLSDPTSLSPHVNVSMDGIYTFQLTSFSDGTGLVFDSNTNLMAPPFDSVNVTVNTPEPCTLALLGLGGLVLRRRKA